jgi:hypothetical protein
LASTGAVVSSAWIWSALMTWIRMAQLNRVPSHLAPLLWPLLRVTPTASRPSPFQVQGKICEDKSISLRCTTARSTSPCLGHEGIAVKCPLTLLGSAVHPHRPASFARVLCQPRGPELCGSFSSL